MKKQVLRIVSVIITLLFFAILLRSVDFTLLRTLLASLSWQNIAVGITLYFGVLVFRALRLRSLITLSLPRTLEITLIHNFYVNLLPARTGEVSFPLLLAKQGVQTSKSLPALVVLRMLDIVAIAFFFMLAVLFTQDFPEEFHTIVRFIMLGSCALVLSFVVFLFVGHRVRRLEFKNGVARKIQRAIITWLDFTKEIPLRQHIITAILTACSWVTSYALAVLVLRTIGVELDMWSLILIATLGAASSVIPVSTLAGFGVVEGVLTALFLGFGTELGQAVYFSVGFHAVFVVLFVLAGLAGFSLAWLSRARA